MEKTIFEKYIKKRLYMVVLLIVLIGVGIAIESLHPYFYGKIIDSILDPNRQIFVKYLSVFFALCLTIELIRAEESLGGNWLVNRIENEMKADIIKVLLYLQCDEMDDFSEGELLNRLEFDAEKIVTYYFDLITSIFMIVINFSISLFFIWKISVKMSIISIALVPILLGINIFFRKHIYRVGQEKKRIDDNYFQYINDILSNINMLKAFGEEENFIKKYIVFLKKKLNIDMRSIRITNSVHISRSLLSNIVNVIILFVAGKSIILGEMSIGSLVAFNSYLDRFLSSVDKAMELDLNRQEVLVSFQRIVQIWGNDREPIFKGECLDKRIGILEVKNVCFKYEKEWVLRNVNMKIQGNGLYSIVGKNGSGKTSLYKLIERFYNVDSGEIDINGNNINQYDLQSLRKSIFYMAKDPVFIQDTILKNLQLGNSKSEEEIISNCKKVGIHEDIISLPKGYSTIIESNADDFSSGQKQKLGFVRVLSSDASLILLDEVTSDLDGSAAKQLIKLIDEISKKAIILNITHKAEVLQKSKRIYLLEKGEILSSGKHMELLETSNTYRELFNSKKH